MLAQLDNAANVMHIEIAGKSVLFMHILRCNIITQEVSGLRTVDAPNRSSMCTFEFGIARICGVRIASHRWRCVLTIVPLNWVPENVDVREMGIDYHETPVYMLAMNTERIFEAELRTRIQIHIRG